MVSPSRKLQLQYRRRLAPPVNAFFTHPEGYDPGRRCLGIGRHVRSDLRPVSEVLALTARYMTGAALTGGCVHRDTSLSSARGLHAGSAWG